MPAGDGTGPLGLGPRTGRGMGYCAGFGVPGYANPGPRLGLGLGWGRGRGWRWWYRATGLPGWARFGYPGIAPGITPQGIAPGVSPQDELSLLKEQAKFLEQQLKAVSQRMKELEKTAQGQ